MSGDVNDSRGANKLPFSLDAEQGLLGAILYDNRTFERLPNLTGAHFYDPAHGRIFDVCAAIIAKKQLADAVTLREAFAETLHEVGGARYLLTLVQNAARMTSHAIEYANVILETSARRDLIAISQAAIDQASAIPQGETFADVLARTERGLSGLSLSDRGKDVGLRDAASGVVEGLKNPLPPGVGMGLSQLDKMIGGLYAPDLIILAGRPGMGKSSLAANIATNVARGARVFADGAHDRNRVVTFFSYEMSAEQLAARALARSSTARGNLAFNYSDFRSQRRPRAESVSPLLLTIPNTMRIFDRGEKTLGALRAGCREIRSRYGALDLIVIDYLQLMEDSSSRRDGRVQEVSAITSGLKAVAKDFNCPVLALAQLSRAVEQRQEKRPQLSDLRESGSIEQDADIVLFAYREHYYLANNPPKAYEEEEDFLFNKRKAEWEKRLADCEHEMEVIAGKNRHGANGTVKLWCDLAPDVIQDFSPHNEPALTTRPHWMDKD